MSSMQHSSDIVVAGAGPAGLCCACLLSQQGLKVCVVAPESDVDRRTVALMQPALRLLTHLGVWPGDLQALSAPLQQLHVIDDTGGYVSAPHLKFTAEEAGFDAFGWNIPIAPLVRDLNSRLTELGHRRVNDRIAAGMAGDAEVRLETSGGASVVTKTVIAADGRNSKLRQVAGIRLQQRNWNQTALVTSFSHSQPHFGISTEHHRVGGVFTTVPLPGNRSSLVWIDEPVAIKRVEQLSAHELATEIQLAAHGELGRVFDVEPVQTFTLTSATAETFAKNRIFLVGEAAHARPPIGAQGRNLSLRDAAHAANIVTQSGDPGGPESCQAYDKLRRGDVTMRMMAVNMTNLTLLDADGPLAMMRKAGLALVHSLPPLRAAVVRNGFAPQDHLPFEML
jgi:2-octaprenyl-6-methoxyphenol hydroxylase